MKRNYRPVASIGPMETVSVTSKVWGCLNRSAASGYTDLEIVNQGEEQIVRRPGRLYVTVDGALFRIDVTPTDRVASR